jgi:hypothetical protein
MAARVREIILKKDERKIGPEIGHGGNSLPNQRAGTRTGVFLEADLVTCQPIDGAVTIGLSPRAPKIALFSQVFSSAAPRWWGGWLVNSSGPPQGEIG